MAILAVSPNVIVASPALKVDSLREVFDRARGGAKLEFGSPGLGTGPALVMDYLVKVLAKVDIPHIPYKGAVAPMTAASTGEVALASTGLAPAVPFIKAGKVKALAVTSASRSPLLPEVPTLAEAGFPAFHDEQWIGAWVPAGTPPALIERLSADMMRAVQVPEAKQRLAGVGYDIPAMSRQEFSAYVRKELAKWAQVAKATGAKAE